MDRFSKYCKVISGYAFKAKDLMEEGDIPVVKIGNISNGGNVNISSNTQYVDRSFLSLDEKYHIKNKDILISLTGSHMNQPNSMVGRSCRSYNKETYLLNQRAGKVIPFDNADKDYLYYLLSSEEMKYSIVIRAYGAANQVNISPSDIEGIKWNFPEYDVQCKIGNILSTYDDLIEKNNRKIEILQDMAEELYKEWFVRFRFPGYKTAKFTDGIPDGWEVDKIESLGVFTRGKNITASEMIDGSIPVISAGIEPSGFHNESNVKGVSITISSSGANAGYMRINYSDIWAADCMYVNNIDNVFYLYELLNNIRPCIDNLQRGAAQPHVYSKDVNRLKILLPAEEVRNKFNDLVKDMHLSIATLMKQNNNLKQQRDLLLPRLMSGKLEVKVS